MPRTFRRDVTHDQAVDVPDWELIGRLGELLQPYVLPDAELSYSAQDARGQYSDKDLAAFRREVENQDEPPNTIWISVTASEPDGATRHLQVQTAREGFIHGHTFSSYASSDEAIVGHLTERTKALFERASHQRAQRLEKLAENQRVTTREPLTVDARVSPPPDDVPWWRQYAAQIVAGLIGTVAGGLILAAVLGAF